MSDIRIIDVRQSVFADNDADANTLRQQLKQEKTFLLNLMSSPGAGKTTLLKKVTSELKEKLRLAVMEADIDSDVDARAMKENGIDSIQIHTGGMCHLDADMTRQGLRELGSKDYDLVILENVGNLVCPAEFDTGAVKNMTILSVPEGHDKPLKYPLMYENCQLLVINKIDVIDYFDFDTKRVVEYAKMEKPEFVVEPADSVVLEIDFDLDALGSHLANDILFGSLVDLTADAHIRKRLQQQVDRVLVGRELAVDKPQ